MNVDDLPDPLKEMLEEKPLARVKRLTAQLEGMSPILRRGAELILEASIVGGVKKHQSPYPLVLYRKVSTRWREIVCQPISTAEKQEACFALLVELINRLAELRVGQVNAPLRFYADMLKLQEYLRVGTGIDETASVAILPAGRLVSNWLSDNAHLDRTTSPGGPLNITGYMTWQQLRTNLSGEQEYFAALEPNSAHSEYVQDVLRRVIGSAPPKNCPPG